MSMNELRGPQRVRPEDRQRLENSPVSYSRVIRLFRPYRLHLVIVIALIVSVSGLTVVQPFLVRAIVDQAIPQSNVDLLLWLIAAMIFIVVVTQAIAVVQTYMSARVGQRIMHRLRVDVYSNLQRQSLGFFTKTKGGEIQSRLTNDIAGMKSIVTSTATSIASNTTTTIATMIAMIALSPTLSLLSVLVLPPSIWLTRRVALTRKAITAQQQETMASMQSMVTENLSVSGMRLTKNLGLEQDREKAFTKVSEKLIELELNSQLAGRWRMATMQIIFAIIPALVYLVAGLPGTSISIGTLVAFTALQTQIFRPLMGLLDIGAQWISAMALFSRVFEYLDLETELEEPAVGGELPTDATVDVRGVTYSYPGSDAPALRDVSFTVPAGGSLAIVGHTGSGKSTLASILTRLADPDLGQVTIGGVDLRDMTAGERTSRIGVVSQETYLVHDTIRANLLLGNSSASEEDMWQALEIARMEDIVRMLPNGLDTIVGARGFRFSGGEQQRLAIARTVLRDPEILILDEATSALDNETERLVQDGLTALSRGRTTITIAHRLSTIRDADQIVVLDDGEIIERGTRDELVEQGGHYALLERVMMAA
ncbi:ABC transporter ATP-binding protein [Flaviflexus massiliensis]|uniref:ABC transporter ATP-binding protein n=1 Tax=Flaviflexus massiliensis TaxID=1522309 RepID=UPI000ACD80F4|nr:ABC transporter ATP-binding protein [Flaviflexus massiliensis]